MIRKRTALALLIVFIVLSLCLAACSKKEASKTQNTAAGFAPKLDRSTACSITVAGHYSNFEALEAEFNRFARYYPNVKMTYVYMDGYSKSGSRILSTALAGSEAPDIFFTYPYMYEWVDGSEIASASENLADVIDLSCIRPNLLKKEADGSILSVPVYTTTYGMMVNEDIFAKEKIAVPRTYSELVSACEALKKAGYENPVMCYSRGSDLLYPLFYPYFCAQIKGNDKALGDLNGMKEGAGEYMRSAMELTADFMGRGFINLEECAKLANNYEAVILRFFEGDVPMMLASGNTVSGTEKREAKSDAFTAKPFRYSFHPVPSTEEGGYFINTISVGFGVNKNGKNLDMANEFMRFLVSTQEMNLMAKAKRMVTPCTDMSLDSVYAPFQNLDAQHFINTSDLGLEDRPASQVSKAGLNVATGTMTVDQAVAAFGSIQ
ncbi:MAG: carbohydrate ABC transporter substrate-binding protein [Spirochaetales bacterium]|nr:carbohydrate ABC transporter substrate-binding protein [Spirochaetales bacterium]